MVLLVMGTQLPGTQLLVNNKGAATMAKFDKEDMQDKFPIGPDAIRKQMDQVQHDAELGREQAISDALTNAGAPFTNRIPEDDLRELDRIRREALFTNNSPEDIASGQDRMPTPEEDARNKALLDQGLNGRPWEPQDLAKKIRTLGDSCGGQVGSVLPLDLEKNASDLGQAIRLVVGAASLCWENMSGTGVFDSAKALDISSQLQHEIERQFGTMTYALAEMKEAMSEEEFLAEWHRLMSGQSEPIMMEVAEGPAQYPNESGDFINLGPEVFCNKDGSVISYKGENYYPGAEIQRQVNQHKASVSRQLSEHKSAHDSKGYENLAGENFD